MSKCASLSCVVHECSWILDALSASAVVCQSTLFLLSIFLNSFVESQMRLKTVLGTFFESSLINPTYFQHILPV